MKKVKELKMRECQARLHKQYVFNVGINKHPFKLYRR